MDNTLRKSWQRLLLGSGYSRVFLFVTLVSASVAASAQQHIQSPEKTTSYLNPANFTIWTDPNGAVPVGQPGSPGYFTNTNAIPPEKKNFYVKLGAQITVATNVTMPTTVLMRTQRIIYTGTTAAPFGSPEDVVLTMQPNETTSNDGVTTYQYKTVSTSPDGTGHWIITNKLGRYRLSINPDYGTSNLVEFKIDKRTQIVTLARDFAALGFTGRTYPPGVLGNSPDLLFAECSSFVMYVYDHLGLTSVGRHADGGPGIANFPLRNPNMKGDIRHYFPLHYAIIDGSEMIDHNNRAYGDDSSAAVRALDDSATMAQSTGAETMGLNELYQLDGE